MTGSAADYYYNLPDDLRGRVASVTFFANHSADLYHIYEWRDDAGSQSAVMHRVFYDKAQNYVWVDNRGTQIGGAKGFKIIVFYI